MAYQLPPISSLSALSTEERSLVLDQLFEPSIPLHTLSISLLREKSFSSYEDMVAGVRAQLIELSKSNLTSDLTWLERILGAHPRLGETKVDSAQSQGEQAQLHTGKAEDAELLAALNEKYEATFPGLRYVVFVNGRPRSAITQDMQSRIERSDIQLERQEAIEAMCEIAVDRAKNLS